MFQRLYLLCIIALSFSACSAMQDDATPPNIIQQLNGTWYNQAQHAKLIFYPDETVKLVFPQHQPEIKMISSYQPLKKQKIGVALGGFWTGPMLINISALAQGSITATLPDEEPITFQQQKP